MEAEDKKPRKFTGTIFVKMHLYYAEFWLGLRKYKTQKEPDWTIGNAWVANCEIEHLIELGHKVKIEDYSDEEMEL